MTRIGVVGGRAVLVADDRCLDVERASDGRFGPSVTALWAEIGAVTDWAGSLGADADWAPLDRARLGCPVSAPSQVFAVGLNYRAHGDEMGRPLPEHPLVFTKFPSSLAGPNDDIVLPSDHCDWELELVVVVGRGGRDIPLDRALDHVAGYAVGQDVSERAVQMRGAPAQFSLGKSFATFGPVGPWVAVTDEIADPTDLRLTCRVDDEVVQEASTADMIFGVAPLVAHLSSICELRPGDLIFTGTPAGVGAGRTPPRYLRPGSTLTSTIDGIGTMTHRCVG